MHNKKILITLYAGTLLLSAMLMFAVQPMVGRMLLPKVGGAPAGWIVAVAFFQICLLAGYFVAHIISKRTPYQHGWLYIGLLAIGLLFLPLNIGAIDISSHSIPFVVLMALVSAVAVPFTAISATSSTIQRLFTATGHDKAHDPYFLYTASNIGSFIGLLGYPLLAEPFLAVSTQTQIWLWGYIALIGVGVLCLFTVSRTAQTPVARQSIAASTGIPTSTRLSWIFLSFVPSCLMMAATTQISTEIVSFPLLWVLPLAVYLLTFILAFSNKQLLSQENLLFVFAGSFVVLFSMILKLNVTSDLHGNWWSAVVHILGFGIIAYYCHKKLADLRPLENVGRDLSDFYLMLAIGGALGGALNAFVFPFIFDGPYEYPLILCVSLFALATKREIDKKDWILLLFSSALVTVYILLNTTFKGDFVIPKTYQQLLIFIPILIMVWAQRWLRFVSLLFIYGLCTFVIRDSKIIAQERNFFGTLSVLEREVTINKEKVTSRRMMHGTTLHGFQILDEKYKKQPTSYYVALGPLYDLVKLTRPWDTLAIGLGTGTVNCLVQPSSTLTFIDIDRAVADMAQEYFTFLTDCPRREPVRVMFGDGRLVLDSLADKKYDLIIVDAFTSDAIPIHLLTIEAIEKMKQHLKTGGVIAYHISNRYFSLAKQLRVQAEAAGLTARTRFHSAASRSLGSSSRWVALTADPQRFDKLDATQWRSIPLENNKRLWTDDFNNLISTLYILEK